MSVLAEEMDNKRCSAGGKWEASLDSPTFPELPAIFFSLWLFLLPSVMFLPSGDVALNGKTLKKATVLVLNPHLPLSLKVQLILLLAASLSAQF